MWHIMCHIWAMPSINLRQLRDTRRLKELLRAGKTVELRERDRVIGRIVPERPKPEQVEWPDFEARAKAIFGDRVFPNAVLEERKRARY
jgi:antitoxin (DNA-binding transcriptional repressor) of toxin-antitoxin stability system